MQTMTRWTDDQMDGLDEKVDGLDIRLTRLEGKVDGLDHRLGRVEVALIELSREMHAEFRAVRGEMKMMQATMIGGFVSLLAAMIVTQL